MILSTSEQRVRSARRETTIKSGCPNPCRLSTHLLTIAAQCRNGIKPEIPCTAYLLDVVWLLSGENPGIGLTSTFP